MVVKNIDNLKIYKKSLELVVSTYKLIQENQSLLRDFSLCDQLKRASVSVSANIAEGYMRTRKQFLYQLNVSIGSSNEMVTLLEVVNLVYEINTEQLQAEYLYLAKQITSFSNKFID